MININNPPPLAGLIFRHFQGESDYAPIARVITLSQAADQMDREVAGADIASAFQHMSNCDPYRDIICAEVAGEMVGYTRGWWEGSSSLERLYKHNGFLVPEWRRKGIGRCMLVWMEDRLRQVATSHPAETSRFFQVNISQFQPGTAALLKCSGYQPVRYYYEMVHPTLENIPDFLLPAGIEIRPASQDHYRQIWDLVVETSLEEWGHDKPTEQDYQEWLSSPLFQPDLWQIAWDVSSNQVVGHVLTYIHHDENKQFNRKRGYTEGIGVQRAWRRRGLARALISRSLRAQKNVGMTESALVVDSANPSSAGRLYERCGFQITKCDTLYRKPM